MPSPIHTCAFQGQGQSNRLSLRLPLPVADNRFWLDIDLHVPARRAVRRRGPISCQASSVRKQRSIRMPGDPAKPMDFMKRFGYDPTVSGGVIPWIATRAA